LEKTELGKSTLSLVISPRYPFHEVGVSLWQIDEVTVIEQFVAFQATENPLNVDQVT
jgi:hypothetical protein